MKFLAHKSWTLAAVAVLSFLIYLPTLRYGFVFDEQLLITNNPAAHDPTRLGVIFGQKFWPGPAAGIYYRPLVILSYAAAYALAGDAPWLHHLFSVLFHSVCSVLVYLLFLRLIARKETAGLSALLFAALPIHAESVAWIPGRTDVLATLFLAAAWLCLFRAREKQGGRRRTWLAAVLAAYLAALMSKEVAVVFLGLAAAFDFLQEGPRARRHLLEYVLLAGVTLAFLAFRGHVLAGPGPEPAPPALAGLGLGQKVSAVILVFACALKEIYLPGAWTIDYAYAKTILAAPPGLALAALVFLAALGIAAVRRRQTEPLFRFCAVGFLLSMLPVSSLVPFPTLFAERFLYLPSLFGAMALGLALARRPPRFFSLTTVVLVGILSAFSLGRSSAFQDDLVFWRTAVREVPDLAAARNWLGLAYKNRDRLDRAELQYEAALKLDPGFTVAAMNLAEILVRRGEPDRARALLEKLIAENPADPILHLNLGLVYFREKKWDQAKMEAEQALALDPENLLAHLLLADYELHVSRDPAGAAVHLEAARRINPRHRWLLKLLSETGR